MLYLLSQSTNPFWNLSLEKYFLEEGLIDIVLFYVNCPSVVVGKNQNLAEEADLWYANQYKITPVRRISGGGTVYHDTGNLNYTFIERNKGYNDYTYYLTPVIQYLNQHLDAVNIGDNHALFFKGKKISGTARAVKKNRLLQHGTLLFDADLEILDGVLKRDDTIIKSKSVKSIRSYTINTKAFLPFTTMQEMLKNIFLYLEKKGIQRHEISNEEEKRILYHQSLLESDTWVFGKSPDYFFKSSYENTPFVLEVKKGIIYHVTGLCDNVRKNLKGLYHKPECIIDLIKRGKITECIAKELF